MDIPFFLRIQKSIDICVLVLAKWISKYGNMIDIDQSEYFGTVFLLLSVCFKVFRLAAG